MGKNVPVTTNQMGIFPSKLLVILRLGLVDKDGIWWQLQKGPRLGGSPGTEHDLQIWCWLFYGGLQVCVYVYRGFHSRVCVYIPYIIYLTNCGFIMHIHLTYMYHVQVSSDPGMNRV